MPLLVIGELSSQFCAICQTWHLFPLSLLHLPDRDGRVPRGRGQCLLFSSHPEDSQVAEQPPNTELERFPKPISGRADGYLAVAKQKVQMGMHKTYLKSSKEKDAT